MLRSQCYHWECGRTYPDGKGPTTIRFRVITVLFTIRVDNTIIPKQRMPAGGPARRHLYPTLPGNIGNAYQAKLEWRRFNDYAYLISLIGTGPGLRAYLFREYINLSTIQAKMHLVFIQIL